VADLDISSITANPTNVAELAVSVLGDNDGAVYTSTDGGQTWILATAPPTRYNAVEFAADGTLFALSGGPSTVAPEGVYRRNPDGTWTGLGPDQGPSYESDLWALQFGASDPLLILASGQDNGVAGEEATIWRSTTAGSQWTKVYEGSVDNQIVGDLKLIGDGGDSVVVGSLAMQSGGEGGVLRSGDGGATWAPSSTGLAPSTQGMALAASSLDPRTLWLLHRQPEGVSVSHDVGRTWASKGYVSLWANDIACNQDCQEIYVTQWSSPFVLQSKNQGASFQPFGEGLSFYSGPRALTFVAEGAPRLLLATSGASSFEREIEWTPVTLSEFAATSVPQGVRLSWRIAPEARHDLTGVRVHRSDAVEGPYVDLTAVPLVPDVWMSFEDRGVEQGSAHWYRLVLLGHNGTAVAGRPISVTVPGGPGWRTELGILGEQNSGGLKQLRYRIAHSGTPVRLVIYDVSGRLITVVDQGIREAGEYLRTWNRCSVSGERVARGVYLVQLTAGDVRVAKKLVLLHE
jgi:photosystem II stability/assembly factor-like uncharacterized protein